MSWEAEQIEGCSACIFFSFVFYFISSFWLEMLNSNTWATCFSCCTERRQLFLEFKCFVVKLWHFPYICHFKICYSFFSQTDTDRFWTGMHGGNEAKSPCMYGRMSIGELMSHVVDEDRTLCLSNVLIQSPSLLNRHLLHISWLVHEDWHWSSIHLIGWTWSEYWKVLAGKRWDTL